MDWQFRAATVPVRSYQAALKDWVYVTEKLEGRTFVQRRFVSTEEERALEQLREYDIDPRGKEAEGHLLAEFYLSRSTEEVAKAPIESLLTA